MHILLVALSGGEANCPDDYVPVLDTLTRRGLMSVTTIDNVRRERNYSITPMGRLLAEYLRGR